MFVKFIDVLVEDGIVYIIISTWHDGTIRNTSNELEQVS